MLRKTFVTVFNLFLLFYFYYILFFLTFYFNTNKPQTLEFFFVFFGRIPVVLESRLSSRRLEGRVRTSCTLPHRYAPSKMRLFALLRLL